jgi:3-hydroxyisobutyrate dehydrogenase-like beta-hydroxyacid dehydrogenase
MRADPPIDAGGAPVSAGETVAVLGAGGTMGRAMAQSLLRAGIAVRAWNRTDERARPLEAEGAVLARTPAEAAEGASFVLTMLRDGEAVIAVMEGEDGALRTMTASSAWLQMSMEESAEARELDLPLIAVIRDRLARAALDHGDEDVVATYLTSAGAAARSGNR